MRNKLSVLFKSILIMTLFLNVIDLSLLSIRANEYDEVSAVVTYNENSTTAAISFDLSNLSEDRQVTDIVTPTLESMDVVSTYEVDENGTYTFIVNFVDVDDVTITSSELKNVEVTDLVEEIVTEDSEEVDVVESEDEIVEVTPFAMEPAMIVNSTHVFSSPGYTLTNYSVENNAENGNHFFVYLKAGEHFQFTTKYGGAGDWGTPATKGNYYITAPDGTQTTVKFPEGTTKNTGVATPDATKGKYTTTITAQTEGVYQVAPVRTANDYDVWHDITFNVEDEEGNYISGRVWSDNIRLKQSHLRGSNGRYKFVKDFTFYHVTSTGYIYKQDLLGYNGINSVVFSDPVGTMVTEANNCTALYADIPQMSTWYSALNENDYCKQQINYNHLFLEYPNADLPAAGSMILLNLDGTIQNTSGGNDTKNIHILPLVSSVPVEIANPSYKNDLDKPGYAGRFSADISNVQGFATLVIYLDDNRDNTPDRTLKRVFLINENGTSYYDWDGLDDEGVRVPYKTKITAKVKIDKAGEIHFNQQDVEQRLGMTVVRLTAVDPVQIGDSTLYYNASLLPINSEKSQNITMFDPISGSYDSLADPGKHSWNYIGYDESGPSDKRNTYAPRLSEFDGRPEIFDVDSWDNPNKHSDSLGDGNYMLDWTYEILHDETNFEIDVDLPGVGIDKTVDIDKAIYTDGLQLEYTITVTNRENEEITGYTVVDALSDLTEATYAPNTLYVDGVLNTDLVDSDAGSYDSTTDSVVVSYPILAAGQISVITFKVDVSANAIGKIINNQAKLLNDVEPENPVFSEDVETKIHDLSIVKEVDKSNAVVGDTLTYKLIVSNNSEFEVDDYSVSDVIADIVGVEYVDNTLTVDGVVYSDAADVDNGSVVNDVVNVYYPSLEANATSVIMFKVTVQDAAKGKNLINVATLLNTPKEPLDPNDPINVPIDSNEVETKIPDLSIVKLVDKQYAQVDDIVTYTVTVTNNSDFDVENYVVNDEIVDVDKVSYVPNSVKVNDVLQTDLDDSDYASFANNTVSVSYPELASKETATFAFEVVVKAAAKGQVVTNVAVLESNDPNVPPIESEEVRTVLDSVSIVKTVDKQVASIGDSVTYTLKVKNNSSHDVSDYLVEDVISDLNKVSYDLDSIKVDGQAMTDADDADDANYTTGAINVLIPKLESAQEVTISFKVIVELEASGTVITNAALLKDIKNPENDVLSNEVKTNIPEVSITKEVNKQYAKVDDTLLYTISVTNHSEFDVNNYVATDEIVSQVGYVENSIKVDGSTQTDVVDSDNAYYFAGTVNVKYPTLLANSTTTFTFEVSVLDAAKGETIPNVALLQTDIPELPPLNSEEVTTVVDDVTISKSVNKQSAEIGDTITYTLNITNNSSHEVLDYSVQDAINDLKKVDYVTESIAVNGSSMTDAKDTDNADYDKGTINVLLPVMAPSEVVTVTFNVVVTDKALGKSFTNMAVLIDPKYPKEEIKSNEVVTEVPNVIIHKEVDKEYVTVGEQLTYTIEVTNNSDFDVTGYTMEDNVQDLVDAGYKANSITVDGVTMTDVADSDVVSYKDSVLNVTYPNLSPNQTSTVSFNVTVLEDAKGQVISNVALLKFNTPEIPPKESEKVVTLLNDVSITKSVDKNIAKVGDVLTYTLNVKNNSAHEVYDISVKDTINSLDKAGYVVDSIIVDGVALTDAKDSDNANYSKGSVNVLYPVLLEGQESTITFNVVVNTKASGHTVTNVALLEDPNVPSNSKSSNEVVTQIPTVSAAKSVDKKTAKVGDAVTYTIVVSNDSDFAVSGFTLTDKIQDATYVNYVVNTVTVNGVKMTDLVDSDLSSYQDQSVLVKIPNLEVGEKCTITFMVKVLDTAKDKSITNVALVYSEVNPEEPTPTNKVVTKVTSDTLISLPNTGISNNVSMFMVIMFISAATLVFNVKRRFRSIK